MKKLLFLLIYPIIIFGQSDNLWKTKQDTLIYDKDDDLIFEQWGGNKQIEHYYAKYNNIKRKNKTIFYFNKIKNQEVSFKGYNLKKVNLTNSDGSIGDEIVIKREILDGFSKTFKNGKSCLEEFWICGTIVFQSEYNCNFEGVRAVGSFNYSLDTINKSREYDLQFMINLFLNDLFNNNSERGEKNTSINMLQKMQKDKTLNIQATFETLGENILALSYGINNMKSIILKVDPENWQKASSVKRWYTLYHELGHDVLNFEHGQGGKMMFNFAENDYTWNQFNEDRNYMFNTYLNNNETPKAKAPIKKSYGVKKR
jgi:hypothetical protein